MKFYIINGTTGIGKSTVAKLLHEKLPLSYLLSLDDIRSNISQYREHREESGRIRHEIGKNIVRACFEQGCDVILEQMFFDTLILDAYINIALEYDVTVREYILWAPKELVMQRANERGYHEGGLLTPEKCEIFWDKINAFIPHRPNATVIDITDLEPAIVVERIYGKVV